MPELSPYNIDQISRDAKRQEITFSHLLDDLIDHICCDVEYEMQNGIDFSEAYRRVKQKMGSRRLKEIQEETLYAVDTKYRQMKSTMKISGIVGTVLLGFASLFKIMHWPGAGIMMVLGAVTLAFIFMPSALKVLWKETHSRKRLFLFIAAFLSGMLFIMGILFKVQHWPGAGYILMRGALTGILFFIPTLTVSRYRDPENKSKRGNYLLGSAGLVLCIAGMLFRIQHWPLASFLLMLGMFILFIIVFPWYTWITWKEEKSVNPMFIYLVTGSMALIVPSAIINLNLQQSYSAGYYIHQEQEQKLYNYLFAKNQSLLTKDNDSLTFTVIEQLHTRTNYLLKIINGIELKMIGEAEGKSGQPVPNPVQMKQTENGQEIQFDLLTDTFNRDAVRDFLLPGTLSRTELESAMTDYKVFAVGMISVPEIQKITRLLDISSYLPSEEPESGPITLMTGLHSLALLKNSLLTAESYILNSLANH